MGGILRTVWIAVQGVGWVGLGWVGLVWFGLVWFNKEGGKRTKVRETRA